jgi:hypothetical protein
MSLSRSAGCQPVLGHWVRLTIVGSGTQPHDQESDTGLSTEADSLRGSQACASRL